MAVHIAFFAIRQKHKGTQRACTHTHSAPRQARGYDSDFLSTPNMLSFRPAERDFVFSFLLEGGGPASGASLFPPTAATVLRPLPCKPPAKPPHANAEHSEQRHAAGCAYPFVWGGKLLQCAQAIEKQWSTTKVHQQRLESIHSSSALHNQQLQERLETINKQHTRWRASIEDALKAVAADVQLVQAHGRAMETAWICLGMLDQLWLPIVKDGEVLFCASTTKEQAAAALASVSQIATV